MSQGGSGKQGRGEPALPVRTDWGSGTCGVWGTQEELGQVGQGTAVPTVPTAPSISTTDLPRDKRTSSGCSKATAAMLMLCAPRSGPL